jgi:nucleoside-diphosphate-sugar epimerase
MSAAPVAFVAGATGYTGRAVVGELVARGVATVAHVRPDSPRLAEWRGRFASLGAEVEAAPWERSALEEAFARRRPTHVFALLGTTRARARREGTESPYQTVDYGLTRLLLDAALGAGIAPKFVYLSAAGAGGAARGEYLAVRSRFERELRASELPYVIARPSFITGPDREERRVAERLAARVADTALAVAGLLGARRVRDRYRSTTGEVLARALVRLALDPAAREAIVESEGLRA